MPEIKAPGFVLSTDALDAKGFFDPRYTCDVTGSSPELRWTDPPEGTAGFALLVHDTDCPGSPYCHWVIYDVPTTLRHLPVGIPPQDVLPNGIRQGLNEAGKLGYQAPCPPTGDRPHRYVFKLFALRALPEIPNRATSGQLLEIISPFILTTAEFVGRYGRAIQRAG